MLRVTGLCEGNPQLNGWFPAQRASSTENVSIWWRHHGIIKHIMCLMNAIKTGLYFQNWMVKITFSSLALIERFVPTLILGKYLAHQNIMQDAACMINIRNMVLIQVGSIWYVQNVNTSGLLEIQILEILDQSEHSNKMFGPHFFSVSNQPLLCLQDYSFIFIAFLESCVIGKVIDHSPLYPESNSVPRFGDGGKAEATQMRGKPPGL